MKHARKISVLILALIFIASVAIGMGVVFAVRNVNVTLLSYVGDGDAAQTEISVVKKDVLDSCRGTVISLVDEDKIKTVLDDGYTLEKFEKVYPCTINITVKHRMDVFAVADGADYLLYDEQGEFLKKSQSLTNTFDNSSPNVLLYGTENAEDIRNIAQVSNIFRKENYFASLRSVVGEIRLDKAVSDLSLSKDKMIFVLRCGISLEIQDFENNTEAKISALYKEFSSLTGEQKLRGKIYCRTDLNGNIIPSYDESWKL